MLFRRVAKHVSDQNWLAVGVDFLIVVLGLIVGLQVNNWNDQRKIENAFKDAQTRLIAEHQSNLDAASAFVSTVETTVVPLRAAITDLRACDASPDALQRVTLGMNLIRGTQSIEFRKTALEAITDNDAFLSLLTEQDREALKEFHRQLTQTQETLNWLEEYPFSAPIGAHPAVQYSDLVTSGLMPGDKARSIGPSQPIDVLCQDPVFMRSFYLWERTARFQVIRGRQIIEALEKMLGS